MNSSWGENDLYQIISKYLETQEQADIVFSCILPHMLEAYGENGITIHNLLVTQPVKLYKYSIVNATSYFQDIEYVILRYKAETGCDIGFPLKRYEDIYNTNIKYENALKQKRLVREQHQIHAMEKRMKKAKCKQAIIKQEDFDETQLVTVDNIKRHLKEKYKNIQFLTKQQFSKIYNTKDLYNKRVGSLVYNNPFRINDIKDQSIYWIGICDCGNYRVAQGGRVQKYSNCPVCCKPEHIYIGERFGHLEIIDQRYILNGKHSLTLKVKCKCDCGSTIITTPGILKTNAKTNCGKQCKYAIEQRKELGESNTNNIKRVFQRETNFTKIGRTESNSNSSTGYLGVTFVPATNTYMAYITFQGKTEILGSNYKTAEQAYAVRLAAQNILHKEYISQMENDEFVKHNKYLTKLLNKVKKSIQKVDDIIEKGV